MQQKYLKTPANVINDHASYLFGVGISNKVYHLLQPLNVVITFQIECTSQNTLEFRAVFFWSLYKVIVNYLRGYVLSNTGYRGRGGGINILKLAEQNKTMNYDRIGTNIFIDNW